jgi:hypothetical protein
MATKTACPVTRTQFAAKAKELPLVIDGKPQQFDVKEFSTGSFGWFANGKVTVTIDGKAVQCQLNCMLTVVGSKDLPQ